MLFIALGVAMQQISHTSSKSFPPHFLFCNFAVITSPDRSVRLTSQTTMEDENLLQGLVEIVFAQRWGYVCRPLEDQEDEVAAAVCQGLGYQRRGARVIDNPTQRYGFCIIQEISLR